MIYFESGGDGFKDALEKHKQEVTDCFGNSINPSTIIGQKFH